MSREPKWDDFAAEEELNEGRWLIRELAGKSIGVLRLKGEFFAILNFCPHNGAEICRGRVSGRVICKDDGVVCHDAMALTLRCPWHHWEFDLRSGSAVAPISPKLKTYPVRIQNGVVQVGL